MTEAAYLTIREAGRLFREGGLSPVDLTRLYLSRIGELDGSLHSYLTVTEEAAMAEAHQAAAELAQGRDRGPLHGIPLALKDIIATRGVRTTAHSKVLQEWIPDEDAAVVTKLREAGAVILGKLSLHEFAMPSPSFSSPFPPALNPWDTSRLPGGSSSGSAAAVAAGLCMAAVGTDTGGSIRQPAALTGIVGLKPTFGRVSCFGVVPLAATLDHVGPMTRTVEDSALLLQAMAGYDPRVPYSADEAAPNYPVACQSSITGLRFGVPRHWFVYGRGVAPDVLDAFEAALAVLQGLGASVVDVEAPFRESREAGALLSAEAYAYHEKTVQAHPEQFGENVLPRLLEGSKVTMTEYVHAQQIRASVSAKTRQLLKEVDALVMPSVAFTALPVEGYDPQFMFGSPSFTGLFNQAGVPAISVPCGFSPAGLPIGMQVATRAFDEMTAIRIAHAYEQSTTWHSQRPPLFFHD